MRDLAPVSPSDKAAVVDSRGEAAAVGGSESSSDDALADSKTSDDLSLKVVTD